MRFAIFYSITFPVGMVVIFSRAIPESGSKSYKFSQLIIIYQFYKMKVVDCTGFVFTMNNFLSLLLAGIIFLHQPY